MMNQIFTHIDVCPCWQSYALGELPTMAERITTIRQLWALTSDLLVSLTYSHCSQFSAIMKEMVVLNVFYSELLPSFYWDQMVMQLQSICRS